MLINTCNSNQFLAESSFQLSEVQEMDARIESLDAYIKSMQSPDRKASRSPGRNKSPNTVKRKTSPKLSVPKSPRYSPRQSFHYSPAAPADRLDIPSPSVCPSPSPSPSIKGILKSPRLSCSTACKCDICISTHLRAQKATEFSKRQMSDIEALAQNLLKELKTMRTIVEDYPSSKFTVEEVSFIFKST